MPTTFRPYHPEQDLLLPPHLREWRAEDHVAYSISEVVEELDLSAFYAPCEGDGRRKMPYEPSMMLTVDEAFQMIVANDLTVNASDQGVLLGLTDQVEETLQAQSDGLLADAGYRKEDDFAMLEQRGIDAYISVRREVRDTGGIDAGTYPATERMVEKLSTPEGLERYRERKHIGEAVNGWIREVMGFRRFGIRGLVGAAGEWDLVCLAANLRRMRSLIVLA